MRKTSRRCVENWKCFRKSFGNKNRQSDIFTVSSSFLRKNQPGAVRSRTANGRVSRHPDHISNDRFVGRDSSFALRRGWNCIAKAFRAFALRTTWSGKRHLCWLRRFPGKRGASITLRKKIPAGAGLGGGSGNAAVTLLALRRFWNVEIPDSDLVPARRAPGFRRPLLPQRRHRPRYRKGGKHPAAPGYSPRSILLWSFPRCTYPRRKRIVP